MRTKRFYEIDVLRGIAVILMVIFHLGFDLDFYGIRDLEIDAGGWLATARSVQFIFIVSTGMTLAISYDKHREKGRAPATLSRLKHALKLFFWAIVISGVTWVLFKDQFVRFGILHFYAASILLSLPLLRLRSWNFIVGVLVLASSIPLSTLSTESAWLFPLGITKPDFFSLDYFPLFPWFGLFLIGVAFGPLFAHLKKENLQFLPRVQPLEWLAQHTLTIYLIHQPILVGLIQLFS